MVSFCCSVQFSGGSVIRREELERAILGVLSTSKRQRLCQQNRKIRDLSTRWYFFLQHGDIFLQQKATSISTKLEGFLTISTSWGVFHLFLLRKGNEGLTKVLRIFRSKGVSWGKGSTGQRRQGSVWFEGITGGVQDFGKELRYWVAER